MSSTANMLSRLVPKPTLDKAVHQFQATGFPPPIFGAPKIGGEIQPTGSAVDTTDYSRTPNNVGMTVWGGDMGLWAAHETNPAISSAKATSGCAANPQGGPLFNFNAAPAKTGAYGGPLGVNQQNNLHREQQTDAYGLQTPYPTSPSP